MEKTKRPKKFKVIEIEGIPCAVVSSWEEEQEARQQGYLNFHYLEGPKKKKRTKKKRWLPGRVRYDQYSGIFDVK